MFISPLFEPKFWLIYYLPFSKCFCGIHSCIPEVSCIMKISPQLTLVLSKWLWHVLTGQDIPDYVKGSLLVFIYFFKLSCRVPKSIGKLLYLCHAALLYLLVLWVDLLSVCGFVDRHPFLICILVRKQQFADLCKSFRCWHFSFCSFKRSYNTIAAFVVAALSAEKFSDSWCQNHSFQNLIFAQRLEFYHQQ